MDVVEFLKEAKRYCKWCKNTTQEGKRRLCEACYFEKLGDIFNLPPMAYRKFVETVEEWRKDHPVETRQSEFLKVFPNAPLCDGVVVVDPCRVDKTFRSRYCGDCSLEECRREYWSQEVE